MNLKFYAGLVKMVDEQVEKVYQFTITLKYSNPPIWRSILVPEHYTLTELNNAIQAVMEWGVGDGHLWQFGDYGREINKKRKITDIFNVINKQILYIYDFGDDWQHIVKLEAVKPADPNVTYPKCIAGRQAAPPCCSGGIYGFYAMLKIIKNPSHPEYEETWEWLRESSADRCFLPGYEFDPDSVDFNNFFDYNDEFDF